MNSGLNDNSGIQFADQENIIIDSNIVQIQSTRAQMKLLPFFRHHLEFWGEGIISEDWHGTVEKLIIENMSIAFEILSLSGTEPEIHLRGNLPPITTYVLKKCYCNTRVSR